MNRRLQVIIVLVAILLTSTVPKPIAASQEPNATTAQQKPQTESPEEKKLREKDESLKKKEEDRKKQEEKARVTEAKKYQTLTDFAADLYASDADFRDDVDEAYLDLQSQHAKEAYLINTMHPKELLETENEGETLKLRRVLYDNPRVQEYVNRLGQEIVPEDSEKLYSFKVIYNPIPLAYTLSTGTVLVSTGMVSMLDNEAQLVYVLAHELAHVHKDHWRIKVMLPYAETEYNKRQQKKRILWASLLTAAGAGIGAAIGGRDAALIGAGIGGGAGYAIGAYYSKKIALDWNVAQENEADDFALRAALGKAYDIQEVPRLYAMMADAARFDNRMQLGFLGARSRIRERTDYAQKLIAGALQAPLQEALKGNNLKGTSPEFNVIMADLKRDNGIEAFYFDMFQMAKRNLQQSVALKSDDPLAAYYYGRVLKQVGRTSEEREIAQQSLLKAISLDTRHEIPEVQLHRALMLMDSKDGANKSEAIAALKSYITAYEHKRVATLSNDGLLPPNVDILYSYLKSLGDKTWTAPDVTEILKASAGGVGNNSNTMAPGSDQIPKIEPASETLSPNNSRRPKKP